MAILLRLNSYHKGILLRRRLGNHATATQGHDLAVGHLDVAHVRVGGACQSHRRRVQLAAVGDGQPSTLRVRDLLAEQAHDRCRTNHAFTIKVYAVL